MPLTSSCTLSIDCGKTDNSTSGTATILNIFVFRHTKLRPSIEVASMWHLSFQTGKNPHFSFLKLTAQIWKSVSSFSFEFWYLDAAVMHEEHIWRIIQLWREATTRYLKSLLHCSQLQRKSAFYCVLTIVCVKSCWWTKAVYLLHYTLLMSLFSAKRFQFIIIIRRFYHTWMLGMFRNFTFWSSPKHCCIMGPFGTWVVKAVFHKFDKRQTSS